MLITMKKMNEKFRDSLRKVGYKATPSRLKVLAILEKTKRPLSPQVVIETLGRQADQATVYRIFKKLKNTGIIRQVDFRHNHPHYELADTRDHHHLICLNCGFSEEVTGCDLDLAKQSILRQTKHFGEIREHALEFYGTCKNCLKKNSSLHLKIGQKFR